MAFVPFPMGVKAELFYRQDGQEVENVFHFTMPATPTVGTMEDLAQDLKAWWNTYIKAIQTSKVELSGIKCTALFSEIAPGIEYFDGLPTTATGSAAGLPNNCTVVIKFTTNARGRSYRGRCYHIGLLASQVVENTISSAAQTALKAAYEQLLNSANFAGAQLIVASRVSDGVDRVEGLSTVVNGVSVNRTLDSQRRRLPERGR